jgi:hypothetical protein
MDIMACNATGLIEKYAAVAVEKVLRRKYKSIPFLKFNPLKTKRICYI